MSYCRWGEDSEVYVYHSVFGGFVIHIAAIKYDSLSLDEVISEDFIIPGVAKINLPYAGETISCRTRKQTLKKLNELSQLGYKVPQRAFDRLNYEIENRIKG